MTQTDQNAAKSSSKGLRIALAVSVALNLGVAGMMIGAFVHHEGPGGRDAGIRDLGFGPFTEALSPDERDALRRAFIAKVPDLRDARRAMRQTQQDVLAALRAVPFDQARLDAALTAQSQRATTQLGTGQQLIRDLLSNMTDQARLAFADRLQERLSRGRDKP